MFQQSRQKQDNYTKIANQHDSYILGKAVTIKNENKNIIFKCLLNNNNHNNKFTKFIQIANNLPENYKIFK